MKFFAIRFYGECVGGSDEALLEEMLRTGRGLSNKCNNIYHDKCENHNGGKECVGVANADYLYRVVQNDESSRSFKFFFVHTLYSFNNFKVMLSGLHDVSSRRQLLSIDDERR